MGFFDDINPFRIIERIARDISGMAEHLGGELSNQASKIRKEFERGDVGAFIGKQAGSTFGAMKTLPTAAYFAARGDSEGVQKALAQGTGSAINSSQTVYGYLGKTDKGQQLLQDKNVDKFTLGLSGDYAGTMRGADELEYTGTISNENRDDMFRLGSKIATIGAGTMAYDAYASASSVGGSAIPGYTSTVGTGVGYAKDAGLAYSAGKALSRGDVAGAVNTIREISGDYGLPELPKAPSWVPDLGDIFADFINNGPGSGTSAPVISNPWVYGGQVDSGAPTASAKAAGVSLLAIAAVAGAIIVAKKKGMV